jgi:hypothetical protein
MEPILIIAILIIVLISIISQIERVHSGSTKTEQNEFAATRSRNARDAEQRRIGEQIIVYIGDKNELAKKEIPKIADIIIAYNTKVARGLARVYASKFYGGSSMYWVEDISLLFYEFRKVGISRKYLIENNVCEYIVPPNGKYIDDYTEELKNYHPFKV